jgi:hypothetical protein
MTGNKVLLILLILIVVLFIVILVWGHGTNAKQLMPLSSPDHPDPQSDQKSFNPHAHPAFLDAFNGLLAPFGPKLQAKHLQPPLTTFDLASNPHYSESILPDSNHKFRQAKFAVRPNKLCAHVVFNASDPVPPNMAKTQDSDKANGDNKTSSEFTFTIFEGGGMLTIDRVPSYAGGSCKVQLQ